MICCIVVCLECLKINSKEKCPNCDWALCSNCQDLKKWHTSAECNQLINQECLYEAIMPLRLFNEALNDTNVWDNLKDLQDHVEARMYSEDWDFFREKVIEIVSYQRRAKVCFLLEKSRQTV